MVHIQQYGIVKSKDERRSSKMQRNEGNYYKE